MALSWIISIFVIHVQNHNIQNRSQLVDDHKLFQIINYLFKGYHWKYLNYTYIITNMLLLKTCI
jgi:hypothetical protein